MLHYGIVSLLAVAAMAVTASSLTTEPPFPEGTQDGPCPVIPHPNRRLQYYRLEGKWNELMRFESFLQPNQCPTSNTYEGLPPNTTVTIRTTNPDGSENPPLLREGVVQENSYRRLFSNPFPSPGFPDPSGLIFETVYTNYRNIHVFYICSELEDNKHVDYAWIEVREGKTVSPRKIKTQIRRLEKLGIDTSRFWQVGEEFCDENSAGGGHA